MCESHARYVRLDKSGVIAKEVPFCELYLPCICQRHKPMSSAALHGVVPSLSPLKRAHLLYYLDGTITDGSKKVRVVGFNPGQQKAIKQFMDSKQSVQFSDCEVKQARRGESMEILLKGTT